MGFLSYLADPSAQSIGQIGSPYFHTSAGIPSAPGAFPSFSPLIALTISSIVGFSFRAVFTLPISEGKKGVCRQQHVGFLY